MARGRGSRGRSWSEWTAAKRDDLTTSLGRFGLLSPSYRPGFPSLVEVEDGRSWHPDPDRGAVTIGGRWARVVVHPRPIVARTKPLWAWKGMPIGLQPPVGLRFESPLKVVTCVRRKVRREVIFALDRQRSRKSGGRGGRRYRRTWRSNIGC